MLLKAIILLPVLYFLALIQSSFLPHFSIFGYSPNFVLILIILFIFFFPSAAIISAFAGGIFLDIFSSYFFGLHVSIILAAVFFIELFLKRYVRIFSK